MIELISKLIDRKSFLIKLNESIPNFIDIHNFLERNSLPFHIWKPAENHAVKTIEMAFSTECNFQDVYILAYLLKDFGIQAIYPARKRNSEITLGTSLHLVSDPEHYAIAEPVAIDFFLNIDPKLSTQIVVETIFENHYSYFNTLSEDEYNESKHFIRSDYNWEKETFDAMTDGQLGRYEDFDGDIDAIMNWSGKD